MAWGLASTRHRSRPLGGLLQTSAQQSATAETSLYSVNNANGKNA